jgi:hypothetical protein
MMVHGMCVWMDARVGVCMNDQEDKNTQQKQQIRAPVCVDRRSHWQTAQATD